MRPILTAIGSFVLGACAVSAPHPEARAPAMAPAVATATGAASSVPVATAAAASTTEADAHTALIARARSEGFVPKVRQGRNVYCRTSNDTGSHIASEKCVNEQQLQEYLTLLDQHRDDYQKMRECAKNGCAPTRNGISPGG